MVVDAYVIGVLETGVRRDVDMIALVLFGGAVIVKKLFFTIVGSLAVVDDAAVVLITAAFFASFTLPIDTLYGPFVGALCEGRNCVGFTSSISCSSFKIVCKLAYGETSGLDVVVS